MSASTTIEEVKFLWKKVSAKTAANVIGSLVAIIAFAEFFITVAAVMAVDAREGAPIVFLVLVHAPLMGLFALLTVIGGMKSVGWLYLPFMAANGLCRIITRGFFYLCLLAFFLMLFVDDAFLGKMQYHYDCARSSGLRAGFMILGIFWLAAIGGLWAVFSYVGEVMAAAFKATKTVTGGKTALTEEGGAGMGKMNL